MDVREIYLMRPDRIAVMGALSNRPKKGWSRKSVGGGEDGYSGSPCWRLSHS